TPIRFESESLLMPSPNDSGLGPTAGLCERETINRNDSSRPNGAEILVQSSAKPALVMPANGAETAALPVLGQVRPSLVSFEGSCHIMENGYPLAALFLLRNLRASNTSGTRWRSAREKLLALR